MHVSHLYITFFWHCPCYNPGLALRMTSPLVYTSLGRPTKQSNSYEMYGLLTTREVKMAGYILTEQAWSIMDLLYVKKTLKHDLCICGTKPVSRAAT